MPIRLDPDKKELTVGVKDLVYAMFESDGLRSDPLKIGQGYLPGRGAMGGEVHRSIQSQGGVGNSDYFPEVMLRGVFPIEDYQVVLQGRLDALFRRDGDWVAQEIKSVAMSPGMFGKLDVDNLVSFQRQLQIYMYLLNGEHGSVVISSRRKALDLPQEQVQLGELLLINLYDRQQRSFPLGGDLDGVAELILGGLELLLREELEEYQRKQELKELARKIRFPHRKYRPFQKEMSLGIQEGISKGNCVLVSAPTGSGKTAAALTPILKSICSNKLRLLCVTSKTTQQWLIWQSLQDFRNQGIPFRGVLIRAKEKLCPQPVMICHESACDSAGVFPVGQEARDLFSRSWELGMLDPETITSIAQEAGVCPFELTLALAYQADVIVGDYNYMFDPAVSLQRFQPEDWANSVLLIDEIHNLYPRGRDIFSPELPRNLIQQCRKELREQRSRADIPAGLVGSIGKWLGKLDKRFRELADRGRLEYPNMATHPVELDVEWWQGMLQELETLLVRYLMEIRARELFPRDNPLVELYWALSKFVDGFSLEEDTYETALEQSRPQRLQIICLDPSSPIGSRLRLPKAAVGLSATLKPVEFFQAVLGLPEDTTTVLDFPSPFPTEHRLVTVVGSVSTRYRYRQRYYREIGDIISRIVAKKFGNYLLFFPSYGFLRAVEPFVEVSDYLRVVQTPGLDEDQRAEMVDMLRSDRPVLMLTVMGGIFSEGIDYAGHSVMGGIIVGPGLPQVSYETEKLREYYHRTRSQGFEFAYLYPGMSRVIQSAGRVIRSSKDRGNIVLIGERFTQQPYMDLFPEDWYNREPRELINPDWEQAIAGFWRQWDG
jgi:DNA excision repair protein ERCC-2